MTAQEQEFLVGKIKEYAAQYGWGKPDSESKTVIAFVKENAGIVIRLKRREVVTCIKHPKFKRPTTMIRKDMMLHEIKAVLENPRAHTGKGQTHKRKFQTTIKSKR